MTRPDFNDNDPITEKLLKLPRKIDFYNYAPGTGGEFFQSMIVLSCPKTKLLLERQNYEERGRVVGLKHDNELKLDNEVTLFRRITYIGMGRHYEDMALLHHFSPDELINSFKYLIINTIVSSRKEINLKTWNDSLIVLSGHFNFRSKKARIWSNYEHWNVLKLNPETQKTQDFIVEMCKKIFGEQHAINIDLRVGQDIFSKYPYQENFPFIEYVLLEDYDAIKYWIENRYGSDMDFDFIDQSVKQWKKVRVDPYL